MTRHDFLKIAGMGLTSRIKLGAMGDLSRSRPLGIQLVAFFKTIDDDLAGILKQVAAIGYTEIESAYSLLGDYYGKSAKDFSMMITDLGMSWKSHHVFGSAMNMSLRNDSTDGRLRTLEHDYRKIIDETALAKVPYLVCTNTPLDSEREIYNSIDILNKAATTAKAAGITLAYHNHSREFERFKGATIYDHILMETGPDLKMELDFSALEKTDADPLKLFNDQPGRFPLWQFRDMSDASPAATTVEDYFEYERVFTFGKKAGLQHVFVGHENSAENPYESFRQSFNFLKKTKWFKS